MNKQELKQLLDQKLAQYNRSAFIAEDPIAIPHQFTLAADIEIAGFFAALFAWGNRTTILQKCKDLLNRMDNAPFQFIQQHHEKELDRFSSFKHRTFQPTDLRYIFFVLQNHYQKNKSLESAFCIANSSMENRLNAFHTYFFSFPTAPVRTRKHLPSPERGSTCKRLNMFLRWMVRKDPAGVDFGLWKNINPAELICPVDVHVARVARELKLIERKQTDWITALELTQMLRSFDPTDPVKYDFALFGWGVDQKSNAH